MNLKNILDVLGKLAPADFAKGVAILGTLYTTVKTAQNTSKKDSSDTNATA